MTSGAAEFEHAGKELTRQCPHDHDGQEEQPPLTPAVVLCLVAVSIAILGLKPWKGSPNTSFVAGDSTAVGLPASASSRRDWRLPMRLSATRIRTVPLAIASETTTVQARPPKSFKRADLPDMVFGAVQGDQWSVPTVEFPHMMAREVHKAHSADWQPMISWRKSSSGETLLPVARVHCGGLSPQAVARRADKFDQMIAQLSTKYSVDENLVKAIITRESCFDQSAVSHVGAIGLMQLMPETAQWLKVKNPAKAEANLAGGVRYFASLQKEFGSLELALAAYNAGPGNVRRYGGIPPFRETQSYVKTVLGFYRRYSAAEFLISS